MTEVYPYPKIAYLEGLVSANKAYELIVGNNNKPITFKAYEKLHGTNCAISYNIDEGKITVQSRNRVLSVDNDHFGFCKFVMNEEKMWLSYFEDLNEMFGDTDTYAIVVYGEWCGKGVMQETWASGLDKKTWFIFDVVIYDLDNSMYWLHEEEIKLCVKLCDVNNVLSANKPIATRSLLLSNLSKEDLRDLKELTEEIGRNSQLSSMYFNTDGEGEGLVFKGYDRGNRLVFKMKSNTYREKGSKIISRESPLDSNISLLVDGMSLPIYYQQVIDGLVSPKSYTSIPIFVKRVSDILKDKEVDALALTKEEKGKIRAEIAFRATKYFKEYLREF